MRRDPLSAPRLISHNPELLGPCIEIANACLQCDGGRPICTRCTKDCRQCTYDTEIHETQHMALKRRNKSLTEESVSLARLLSLLQHHSEDIANETFRLLRCGTSLTNILKSLENDSFCYMSPSSLEMNRTLLPPTESLLESNLVMQHPNVYPPLIPLGIASLRLDLLGIEPLSSFAHAEKYSISEPCKPPYMESYDDKDSINPSMLLSNHSPSSGAYVDSRLAWLNVHHWTNVGITDRLASEAISLYLDMNQPWWAFFDTELFLDDLINRGTQFCSRLLVNSVLAWACVRYIDD
jgi:hypothetical protein